MIGEYWCIWVVPVDDPPTFIVQCWIFKLLPEGEVLLHECAVPFQAPPHLRHGRFPLQLYALARRELVAAGFLIFIIYHNLSLVNNNFYLF